MARKSRKNIPVSPAEQPALRLIDQRKIKTALYARISVEREEKDPISTQIKMIEDFIRNSDDLELTDSYIDNGFSGTEFNRPDFVRMMDDARKGKIECIVVKDLSRFGRNFLETGYYIESLLPKLNIRLISVNDDFDSVREEDRNNIAVPLKNMVNEFYARDISKKVSNYHAMQRKSEAPMIVRATYGYMRNETKNGLVPNPDTAPVVKMIFRWYLMGMTTGQIAKRLNTLGIMSPRRYRYEVEKGIDRFKDEKWNNSKLMDILKNEIYIGTFYLGRRRKAFYLQMPEHETDPEEWAVYKNHHEPLILEEDFYKVQEIIGGWAEITKEKEGYEGTREELGGKVYCAKCGKHMFYEKYIYNPLLQGGHYYCNTNKSRNTCNNKINAEMLKMTMASQMQIFVQTVTDQKALLRDMNHNNPHRNKLLAAESKLQRLKLQLENCGEKSALLYENFAEGILTTEEYQEFKVHYQKEKEKLESDVSAAELACKEAFKAKEKFLKVADQVEGFLGDKSFNPKLYDLLVERIYVSPDGSLEIQYACEDVFQQVI